MSTAPQRPRDYPPPRPATPQPAGPRPPQGQGSNKGQCVSAKCPEIDPETGPAHREGYMQSLFSLQGGWGVCLHFAGRGGYQRA